MNPSTNLATSNVVTLPVARKKREKHDITRIESRKKLAARNEPYWSTLTAGQALGFRKAPKGADMWYARVWTGKVYEMSTWDGALEHREAKRLAEEWIATVTEHGGVKQAKLVYVADLFPAKIAAYKDEGRADTAAATEVRFKRLGLMGDTLDPITEIKLANLREEDVKALVARMGDGVALQTLNRYVTTVRTAFMLGHSKGVLRKNQFGSALCKVRDPKTGKVVKDGVRKAYLTKDQRRAIIENVDPHYTEFFKVVAGTPIRIGAIAAMKGDWWQVLPNLEGVLTVREDKAGAGREVTLFNGVKAIITARAEGKDDDELLFANQDGNEINSDNWGKAFNDAVAACEAKGIVMPKDAVPYSFRHSVITDMVDGGVNLLHVAKIAGTSLEMINEHYAKLLSATAQKAMEAIEL